MIPDPKDTVGQYLRRHREAKRMSIEEVSRATRVPTASIEKIEADQFDELPGEVSDPGVGGWLRRFCRTDATPVAAVVSVSAGRQLLFVQQDAPAADRAKGPSPDPPARGGALRAGSAPAATPAGSHT